MNTETRTSCSGVSVGGERTWSSDECRAYLADLEREGIKRCNNGYLMVPNPSMTYGLLSSNYKLNEDSKLVKVKTEKPVSIRRLGEYCVVGLTFNGMFARSGSFFLHRAIYTLANKSTIQRGYDIHHIDGNPGNNLPSNLKAIPPSGHSRYHNLGKAGNCGEGSNAGIVNVHWCKRHKVFIARSSIGCTKQEHIARSPCIVLAYQMLKAYCIKHNYPAPEFTPSPFALERTRPAKTSSKAYKLVSQLVENGIIEPMPLTVEVA